MNPAIVQFLAFGDILVMIVLGLMSVWGLQIAVERKQTFKKIAQDLSSEQSEWFADTKQRLEELNAANDADFAENYPYAAADFNTLLGKGLPVLGTMGNSAPFIGLFGTVLGIIKAFQDLANATQAGPQIVMAGISQALIATALGLFVAIPAVIAFNYFSQSAGALRKKLKENLWADIRKGAKA